MNSKECILSISININQIKTKVYNKKIIILRIMLIEILRNSKKTFVEYNRQWEVKITYLNDSSKY